MFLNQNWKRTFGRILCMVLLQVVTHKYCHLNKGEVMEVNRLSFQSFISSISYQNHHCLYTLHYRIIEHWPFLYMILINDFGRYFYNNIFNYSIIMSLVNQSSPVSCSFLFLLFLLLWWSSVSRKGLLINNTIIE